MPIRRRPAQPPTDDVPVTLGVAAVARRLGVATGTLRTWDRRYGLGPSAHEAGTRRRYTVADLARLTLMRRLMLEGVAHGRRGPDGDRDRGRLAARRRRTCCPEAAGGRPRAAAAVPHRRRPGGRRPGTPARPPAGWPGRRWAWTATPAPRCCGPAWRGPAWCPPGTTLLVPVLAGVGDRWRSTGAGVEVEHLLSECAEAALRVGPGRRRPAPQRPAGAARRARARGPPAAAGRARRRAGRAPGGRPSARRPAAGPRPGRRGEPHRRARGVPLGAGRGRPGPAARRATCWPAVRPRPAVLLGGPGWDGQARPAGRQPGAPTSSRPSAAVITVVSGGVPAR